LQGNNQKVNDKIKDETRGRRTVEKSTRVLPNSNSIFVSTKTEQVRQLFHKECVLTWRRRLDKTD
jgi:hypothetical protein